MTHLREDTIQAYLDRELTPAQRDEAKAHIRRCAECREALAEYRRMYGALAEDVGFELPDDFAARTARRAERSSLLDNLTAWGSLASAAAVVVFVAVYYLADLSPVSRSLNNVYASSYALVAKLVSAVVDPFIPLIETYGERGQLILFGGLALLMVAVLERLLRALKRGRISLLA